MKKYIKIQAGALQFVVFISIVIAVLLAAFLMLTHTHHFFKKQSHAVTETVKNAEMGITHALVKGLPLHDSVKILTVEATQSSVSLYRSYWGIFEKITAISKINKKSFTKTALVGGQFAMKNRPALFLEDQHIPLVLVGHTHIEGTAYLPEKTVRPGNIAGKAYYGEALIYGTIRKSYPQLPQLPQELTDHLQELISQKFHLDASIMPKSNNMILGRSFTQPASYIYSDGVLDLSGWHIRGNIVIAAKEKIIVTADTQLHDIILVAPEIDIYDDVQGNFQAMASKNIHVGKRVTLHYPSALVLKTEKSSNALASEVKSEIYINENSTVRGVVFFLDETQKKSLSAQVHIMPDAKIFGELYCRGSIALEGAVYGTVYTSNFRVNYLGTAYQNHILNGKILSKYLPEAYAGLPIGTSEKNIIQWLY